MTYLLLKPVLCKLRDSRGVVNRTLNITVVLFLGLLKIAWDFTDTRAGANNIFVVLCLRP